VDLPLVEECKGFGGVINGKLHGRILFGTG
jgi:hypothetical protein